LQQECRIPIPAQISGSNIHYADTIYCTVPAQMPDTILHKYTIQHKSWILIPAPYLTVVSIFSTIYGIHDAGEHHEQFLV
jgi:hypothetical protein